jgi:signal transduction histidine kinase
MRTMVDAMLTIQRLDAGTAFLRLTTVDVSEVIKKIAADFQPMAELEGHTLVVNLPERLPPVEADSEKLGLVLSNLLSNAIKFTPEKGRIEVNVRDFLKGILVSVRDNGAGIPHADQERIFERFYQARVNHIAGHGGMGLGLTIVKHLVELHEGQVWVESEPGHGSTFFFTVPYRAASEDKAASPTDVSQVEKQETMLEVG